MMENDNHRPRELAPYLPTDTCDWVYAHIESMGDLLFQKVGEEETTGGRHLVKCRYPCLALVVKDKKKGIGISVQKLLFAALGIIKDELVVQSSRIVCVGVPTAKAISMALSEWKPPLLKIVKPGEMNRLKDLDGEGVN